MTLNVEKNGAVSLISLNNQGALSQTSSKLLKKLAGFLISLEKDKTRAVIMILDGCQKYPSDKNTWESSEHEEDILRSIADADFPIIASLKGTAAGFVFRLVVSSHICVAADSAMLFSPKALRAPNFSKTKEKLDSLLTNHGKSDGAITNREISLERAVKLGIVNKIVSKEELEEVSFELANRISSLAPLAIRACLEATNKGLKLPLVKGLKLENQLFVSLFNTEDMREGVAAFLEKREPKFECE